MRTKVIGTLIFVNTNSSSYWYPSTRCCVEEVGCLRGGLVEGIERAPLAVG
jgi:hypothetical protein